MIPFIWKSTKCKLAYSDPKQIISCFGEGDREGDYKGETQGNFWQGWIFS